MHEPLPLGPPAAQSPAGAQMELAFAPAAAARDDAAETAARLRAHVAAVGSPGQKFIALVDASGIMLVDSGTAELSASREAAVAMDDAPTGNATTGAGSVLVSMFQTDSVALVARRRMNWMLRRTGFVQVLRECAY